MYYYFASKEAALEAVCADGVAEYEANARRVQRSQVSASEKVAQLMFHHLAPLAERLDFTLTFLRERRFLPAPARERIRAIEQRYERIIQRVIEQGHPQRGVPRRPRCAHGHAGAARLGQLGGTLVRPRARRHARAHHDQLRRSAGARIPRRRGAAAAPLGAGR